MAFIDKLQKRLFAKGAEQYSEERFQKATPKLASQNPEDASRDEQPPWLVNIEEEARAKRRKVYTIVGILAAIILVAGGTVAGIGIYRAWYSVSSDMVHIDIDAPNNILSGEDVEYQITVRNESRVVWEDVILSVTTPPGLDLKISSPSPHSEKEEDQGMKLAWTIGKLHPNQQEEFSITGQLIGEEGTSSVLDAVLSFVPEGKTFTVSEKRGITVHIERVPIDIALETPRQASSGERLKIEIVYQNRTTADVTNARIVFVPPEGFTLDEMVPEPTDKNELYWDIEIISQQESGTIIVTGIIDGVPGEARPFTAKIGFVSPRTGEFVMQRDVQASTMIERRALAITQTHNDEQGVLQVNPGDEVKGSIVVRNTGGIGLRDVIVVTALGGSGVDGRTVRTDGFYDSRASTVRWSPASVEELAVIRPGEAVELKYSFHMLHSDQIPCRGDDDSMSLEIQTSAESPDIPVPVGTEDRVIRSGVQEIMLNSVLGLVVDAFYDDGRTVLPESSGPVPPRVGDETTFTIRTRVSNTTNQVIDGSFKIVIPEGIEWLDESYVTQGSMTYQERNREVQWNTGIIPSCAGTAVPWPEIAFQVGLTPSLAQLGAKPSLVLGSSITGKDVFTTAILRAEARSVDTGEAFPGEEGKVVR